MILMLYIKYLPLKQRYEKRMNGKNYCWFLQVIMLR